MAAFAERFGFSFVAHEPGDANRSGRVERPFSFIENNFLAGRTFSSWILILQLANTSRLTSQETPRKATIPRDEYILRHVCPVAFGILFFREVKKNNEPRTPSRKQLGSGLRLLSSLLAGATTRVACSTVDLETPNR